MLKFVVRVFAVHSARSVPLFCRSGRGYMFSIFLYCSVWVEHLRLADSPSNECYQMSINEIPKSGRREALGGLYCPVVPCKKQKIRIYESNV
jgi:hypothetical protein